MVNRIRKKYFKNIKMSKEGLQKAHITWEKWYVVHLIIVCEFEAVIEATRDFTPKMEVDVCVQIVRNALK